ncbi:MAG: hypothetical protein A2Z16_16145 [Chloroflexi bacterium RBG_16_54_18]|nr:MAG: hypothetical protein A2Z16_16145 [Chloroflexi bacterium RBG_16_54_18]
MRFLFVFLDGLGLGTNDPLVNPLAAAEMPALQAMLGGGRLVKGDLPVETERATLLALDAGLGTSGLPQSATGQAVLLTGINIPNELGYHYGPKPNQQVAEFVHNGNLFSQLKSAGHSTAFLNAYPPRYFEAIQSGRRLYSAIPLAAISAGLPLLNSEDLKAGRAISADFSGEGWKTHLGLEGIPVLTHFQAGERLSRLAEGYDFSFFEYWLSDYAGHAQDMPAAIRLLEEFDQVLAGLFEAWDDSSGLILVTSDHGNLEDLSTRRHTDNPVPGLVIGSLELRREFTRGMADLVGIAPAILRFFRISG